jgi:hypothetical protein
MKTVRSIFKLLEDLEVEITYANANLSMADIHAMLGDVSP